MKSNRPPALTKDQKQTIKERLNDIPKDIANDIGATFEQVRNYQWLQRRRAEDIFNCCPITVFKRY